MARLTIGVPMAAGRKPMSFANGGLGQHIRHDSDEAAYPGKLLAITLRCNGLLPKDAPPRLRALQRSEMMGTGITGSVGL